MAQIKGKWAYSISNHPVMHEIMGYRGMSGDLVMRRLYDHNNILMKEGHARMKFFNELKFMTEFQVLGPDEQAVFLASLEGTDQVLKIKYRV